ncbi:MAG: 5-formyltetrahydrofolate cyclo-ligase [Planctomycetia bacterium]|nr:5-formyltetrahydrofolate cyclo-ligase [Planctomycetia bacterium]
MSDSLNLPKKALRAELRQKRKSLDGKNERSAAACRSILASKEWKVARNVMIYVAHGSETKTEALMDAILKDSRKRCFLPVCEDLCGTLKIVEILSRLELAPGAFGILEPCEELQNLPERVARPEDLDLIVAPGVGFDHCGRRLGQGGGFYDRLFEKIKKRTRVVGLAFDCQLVETIPSGSHDARVHAIATESGLIPRAHVVGILGGIASGKSLVTRFFKDCGAVVFDADRVAKEALDSSKIKGILVERWGANILSKDGQIDRLALASIVFAPENAAELDFLNRVIHPIVHEEWRKFQTSCNTRHQRLRILDAPLLLEAGWESECTQCVFIDTPLARRKEFAQVRGWEKDELEKREKKQLPIDEKRAHATCVVRNDGTEADLREEIERFCATLREAE